MGFPWRISGSFFSFYVLFTSIGGAWLLSEATWSGFDLLLRTKGKRGEMFLGWFGGRIRESVEQLAVWGFGGLSNVDSLIFPPSSWKI